MLVGLRGKGRGLFNFLPVSRDKNGFSLVEIIVVIFIAGIIIGALIFTLNTGQNSSSVSSAKADLQAGVRSLLEWIAKDVRQSISWDIANNNPSPTSIKFRQVAGWDSATHALQLSNNYIEYEYDAASEKMVRRLLDASGSVLQAWEFKDIVALPFYARDLSGSVVPLNENDLRTTRRLVILISGYARIKSALNINFSLTEEVKIRNE